MNDRAAFESKIREAIDALGLDRPSIRFPPNDNPRLLLAIVTPTFEGMDEAKRQSLVYEALLEHFSFDDLTEVEFIFTDAPSEIEEEEAAGEPAAS